MNAKAHLSSLIHDATEKLQHRCGVNALFEARLLLGLSLGYDDAIYPHMHVEPSTQQIAFFHEIISERSAGKPLSRIRGWREFWSMQFFLNKATLDPRPESELLVEKAVSYAQSANFNNKNAPRLLDLGTGSGCLLLACLNEIKQATGVGVDISHEAVFQAEENAKFHKLEARSEFMVSNWFEKVTGSKFDIILCNPPYISEDDKIELQDEVRIHDPEQALFSENNGLSDYELILSALAQFLNSDGIACVEIGFGQVQAVTEMALNSNLEVESVYEDLQGIPRCLLLRQCNNMIFEKR